MISAGWFLAGIIVLVVGAELVVRGGSRLAARLGVSPLVIGLTVVAIGTSTPELAIGIDAAVQGNGSLAVGNIAGTNTFNILFILGLTALLDPLAVHMQTLRFNLPVMIAVAGALLVMAWDGDLTRTEGVVMVGAALVYTAAVIRSSQRESRAVRERFTREYGAGTDARALRGVGWNLSSLLVGIAVIVVGADWLVAGAVGLARLLGVSEAFIGLTIVAIGTSAPELVTAIVSTLRKERDIAVGNLIGSSIYNIGVILGVTCLVSPISIESTLVRIDIPVMIAVMLVCVPVFASGHRVSRQEGTLFVTAYIVYLIYLLFTRT
jgi:cation:H+ antiporter